jgi:uncharacterized protein YndB with AHSA1/START domain
LTSWFCEFADVSTAAKAYDFWGRFTPEAPATQQAGHHPLILLEKNRHLAYRWRLNGGDHQVLIKLLGRQDETVLTLRQTAPAGTLPPQGWQLRDFWFLSLENLRAYLAGKPAAARVDFSGPMVGDIHHEITIDAPAGKVFEVLIRPDQIDRWIGNGSTVDAKEGGSYSFGWMGMKILEIKPDEKLSVSPTYDNNSVEEITPHAFTWTLRENNGKTRLTFVHSGFAPDESNASANLGWLSYMVRLKAIAEFDAEWQHPLVPMEPEFNGMYPIDIVQHQDDLLDELLAPADPLLSALAGEAGA